MPRGCESRTCYRVVNFKCVLTNSPQLRSFSTNGFLVLPCASTNVTLRLGIVAYVRDHAEQETRQVGGHDDPAARSPRIFSLAETRPPFKNNTRLVEDGYLLVYKKAV